MDPPVPAVAALEQVAAEGDPRAVAGRKEEVVLGELGELVPRHPGSAVAVIEPASIVASSSRETSSSMPPSRTWFPAQLCPPERSPIFIPSSRAVRTARMTSSSPAAWTIRSGKRSGVRALRTVARRASS